MKWGASAPLSPYTGAIMATILYKDGVAHRVPTKRVQQHLKSGFTTSPEPVAPTFEEADTNESGKLSPDEVRAAAKEAEIEGWETKRIKTLKKELGLET
jgi:hypothetical protein